MRHAFFIACFLTVTIGIFGNDPNNAERDFIEKLRNAQYAVQTSAEEVKKQGQVVAKARKIYLDARHKVDVVAKEVRIRRAHYQSQAFGRNRREQQLLKEKARLDALIKTIQDKHDAADTPKSEKKKLLVQLAPLLTELGRITSQIAILKRESSFEKRVATAKAKLADAKKRLQAARDALIAPKTDLLAAIKTFEALEAAHQKHVDALAALRLQTPTALAGVHAPYLVRVEVLESKSGLHLYDAEWITKQEALKEEALFYQKVVEAEKKAIESMRVHRNVWVGFLDAKNREWQAVNDKYIDQINEEKWHRIYAEFATSVLKTVWTGKGTFKVSLLFEVLDRGIEVANYAMGTKLLGYEKPDYGFPEPVDTNQTVLDVVVDKSRGIFGLKDYQAALKTFCFSHASPVIGSLVTTGPNALADALRESRTWVGYQAYVLKMAEGAGRLSDRHLKDAKWMHKFAIGQPNVLKSSSKLRQYSLDAFGGFVKGAAVNAGKEMVMDKIKEERFKIYRELCTVGLEWKLIHAEIQASINREEEEKLKLKAANFLIEDALKRMESSGGKRVLRRRLEDTIKTEDAKAFLRLTFSSEVEGAAVTLADKQFSSEKAGKVVTMTIDTTGLPDLVEMSVEAKGRDTKKAIDSQPEVMATFDSLNQRWAGYAPGPDRNHKFKLKKIDDGVSLVFLFDCSGSMNDNNKLARAKEAAKRILTDDSIFKGAHNEVAVWCFVNTAPRLVQPFTNNMEAVAKAIDGLTAVGGTPLAQSILTAGNYLVYQAYFKDRALVILSDGEETEDGNPHHAVEEVKKAANAVRKEGW